MSGKCKLESKYRYLTPALCRALGASRFTIIRWERLGKFTAPRNMAGRRIFTAEQLKQIQEAFSPGGAMEWHFGRVNKRRRGRPSATPTT